MSTHLVRVIALGFVLAAGALAAGADEPPEPPLDSPDGEDVVIEAADSLADGDVEIGYGARGRLGDAPRRSRRMRVRGGAAGASFRDGDDALAGGVLEAPAAGGRLALGRLSPRWGQGLVFGAPPVPWNRARRAGGASQAPRGRAGEGLAWSSGDEIALETLAGRFSRRRLAGGRLRAGIVALGVLAPRAGATQGSLALEPSAFALELAADAHGRWRGEGVIERERGPLLVVLRAREGHAGFRSLAEPLRAGPARTLALTAQGASGERRVLVHGALWSFRPGRAGARGSLELSGRLSQHASLAGGFEEQRGPRRDVPGAREGVRQGAWAEGSVRRPGVTLEVRHERWGERPWSAPAARAVLVARAEAELPAGSRLAVTHAVYRTRRGETIYLLEPESDRITLRSLAGSGMRTRIEGRIPWTGGTVRGSVTLAETATRRARPAWTLEWSRRSRW